MRHESSRTHAHAARDRSSSSAPSTSSAMMRTRAGRRAAQAAPTTGDQSGPSGTSPAGQPRPAAAAAAVPPSPLRALDEAPSATDRVRAAHDRAPPTRDEPLQVGTRVSVVAGVFDSKYGISWSRATFGEGGESTRIYGTIKELLTEGRGKQTYYRVKWDAAAWCSSAPSFCNTISFLVRF